MEEKETVAVEENVQVEAEGEVTDSTQLNTAMERMLRKHAVDDKMAEIRQLREAVTDLNGVPVLDQLDEEAIGAYSEEEIQNASPELIATLIPETVKLPDDPEFVKSILLFVQRSYKAEKMLEEELVVHEAAIAEDYKELGDLIGKLEDQTEIVFSNVRKSIADYEAGVAGDEATYKKNLLSLQAYDDAKSLDFLAEHYQKLGTANTKEEIHKSTSRGTNVYKKFINRMKSLDSRIDISKFANLEKKYLPEQYHGLNNVFVYSVIKYIGYKTNVNKSYDGILIGRIALALDTLYRDAYVSDEKRSEFLSAIMKVLDVFMD